MVGYWLSIVCLLLDCCMMFACLLIHYWLLIDWLLTDNWLRVYWFFIDHWLVIVCFPTVSHLSSQWSTNVFPMVPYGFLMVSHWPQIVSQWYPHHRVGCMVCDCCTQDTRHQGIPSLLVPFCVAIPNGPSIVSQFLPHHRVVCMVCDCCTQDTLD